MPFQTEENFLWFVEGLLLISIGAVGLCGNSFSLFVFSRQKKHRIFHNLLLLLTVYDMIYVICSILIFCIPKFSTVYKETYRKRLLPWTLPMAHIGLMGSVYCTMAMTIERFLTVCYPFLPQRRVYSTRSFVIPIIFLTTIYNIPKFFELRLSKEYPGCRNLTQNESVCSSEEEVYRIRLTPLRKHQTYVRVYILWMNLIFHILIPFIVLTILNLKVYRQCRVFEKTFTENIRICFSTTASARRRQEREESAAEESQDKSGRRSYRKSIVKKDFHNPIASLRKREVLLAKISIYITFVFLLCHGVRLIPNSYEMYSTYVQDPIQERPSWTREVTAISHLLLTFASSANFFIYYIKHGYHPLAKRGL